MFLRGVKVNVEQGEQVITLQMAQQLKTKKY